MYVVYIHIYTFTYIDIYSATRFRHYYTKSHKIFYISERQRVPQNLFVSKNFSPLLSILLRFRLDCAALSYYKTHIYEVLALELKLDAWGED